MKSFLAAVPLLAVPAFVLAGDYTATLLGDATDVCNVSFSTEAESVDGVHPLEAGDITSFSCTIDGLSLTGADLQYPLGGDYRVVGGEVTEFDLQSDTGRQLQFGTYETGQIDNFWQVFGHGSLLNTAGNAVTVAPAAPGGGSPTYMNSSSFGSSSEASDHTFSITQSSGSNRLLVVCATVKDQTDLVTATATYGGSGGVPMTVLQTEHRPGNGAHNENWTWYLLESSLTADGSKDIFIDIVGGVAHAAMAAIYFQDVNQGGPFGTPVNVDQRGGVPTIDISSATDEIALACMGTDDQGWAIDVAAITEGVERTRASETGNNRMHITVGTNDGASPTSTIAWGDSGNTFETWGLYGVSIK